MARTARPPRSTGPPWPRRRSVGAAALALLMVVGLTGCYDVALFGDMPYSSSQYTDYERLLADVNRKNVTFSAHVGDFQARTSDCTDSVVERNINWFDSLNKALIFTPGDNDWTDCNAPLTRLARLRDLIFRGTGTESRGHTTRPLVSQAADGFPENARWTEGAVTYVTVHVVGSSDTSGDRTEFNARRAANIAWLHTAFESAKTRNDLGVVIITQASVKFEKAEGLKGSYETMFQAVRSETLGFPGQVLYVHGDSHSFTDDRPMRTVDGSTVSNFRRVEVPGGGPTGWVKLSVNTDPGAQLFSIALQSN